MMKLSVLKVAFQSQWLYCTCEPPKTNNNIILYNAL
uniref:Uncharacterized protein n=1 Tax=Rhizophora mucronata TaxID=61149 RepID=A0A2P2N4B9_RHIMU